MRSHLSSVFVGLLIDISSRSNNWRRRDLSARTGLVLEDFQEMLEAVARCRSTAADRRRAWTSLCPMSIMGLAIKKPRARSPGFGLSWISVSQSPGEGSPPSPSRRCD